MKQRLNEFEQKVSLVLQSPSTGETELEQRWRILHYDDYIDGFGALGSSRRRDMLEKIFVSVNPGCWNPNSLQHNLERRQRMVSELFGAHE